MAKELAEVQIIPEAEVETLERSIQEKDGELKKKETELKAAMRTTPALWCRGQQRKRATTFQNRTDSCWL